MGNMQATSIDAYRSLAKPIAGGRGSTIRETLRERVAFVIGRAGSRGMTTDEVEITTGLTHQTASARVNELAKLERIVRTDVRRRTRSGRTAFVYVDKLLAGATDSSNT